MTTTTASSLIDVGRRALVAWEAAKPKNFFTADADQQHRLRMYLGDAAYAEWEPRFTDFGEKCAGEIDALAIENNRDENLPTLRRYSNFGERTEEVVHHPAYGRIADLIWEAGIMAGYATPGQEVAQMGLYYLIGQNGEAGQNCPLACTAGLIKAIQRVGSREMQQRWLPGLLSTTAGEYLRGAQFLTEVQGGSDVGANATTATDAGDGTWRLDGEKWFCSVADADLYLVTARADASRPGTAGLAMFLMPRVLDDGQLNGLYLRRLKDKLGTRSMASGELDLQDAVAYPIGPIEGSFKNALVHVITTSRLYNAMIDVSMMRRAFVEAATFAQHRTAFDHVILQYPLVQDSIARLKVESQAAAASTFYLFHLADRITRGEANDEDQAAFRLGVSVNKYRASIECTTAIREAMEVLAGNATIEDFSVLPRLLRDSIVCEMWEGTHNVLAQQVLRDMQKLSMQAGFFDRIHHVLESVTAPDLGESVAAARELMDRTAGRVQRVLAGDTQFAARHVRRVMDDLSDLLQLTCLLREGQWQEDQGLRTDKADVVEHFVHLRLRQTDPMDVPDLAARVERLVQTV